ncbi:hypothetical protein IFM89_010860 [Coptis chinensis]|uniref:Tyrosine-protein kinase catalytic domain-containing protein n=1 Tax=Coptis chinensis TaxID=261450 RepID=A0A835I407_9MAGN|nr:hypothetical protein IFM89_010860 [Coptis chinensis]
MKKVKLGRISSHSSTEIDDFSIPGLPVRFEYEELDVATNKFQSKIGSSGFGDVYKGTLPDKTIVAVKKISNMSNQGKKEFCIEIAIIGNTHHVNLVRFRGFCAQGRQLALPVYFPLYALEMHEQRKYMELADLKLERRVTSEEIEKLLQVALCCVHEDLMLRPSMANVVSMLEGKIPLGVPRVEGLNFLWFYGRRFTEASTIEGSNMANMLMLFPDANASQSSNTTGSYSSLSYISSQQISGPR